MGWPFKIEAANGVSSEVEQQAPFSMQYCGPAVKQGIEKARADLANDNFSPDGEEG